MALHEKEIFIDRLDRQILHALAINARTSFRGLANVLGASEQTVARRYRRLSEAGVVHVLCVAAPDPADQGALVRLQVQPAAARGLAGALAKLPDVSYIGLMSAGAEIVCSVRARTRDARNALLLDQLPRTGRVLGITAYNVMHRFATPGRADWSGFPDPLDEQQAAALAPGRISGPREVLTDADEPLLAALAEDGRATYAQLSARLERPEAQIARRLEALLSSGAIYLDVDIAAELLGFSTTAMLYLTAPPSQLHAVGLQLEAHAESTFVAAVTGPSNLVASTWFRDLGHLYQYVSGTLGGIPAIEAVETSIVFERVKQARSLMAGRHFAHAA
jgi:DNA-binding Lrp family transcriptional regulator